MSKRMLIARSIPTSGPGQLTLYDCHTVAKKRKASLNTSDGASGSSRQGDTYMSKECSSRDEDHEVDLRLSREASETPEAEESYSVIRSWIWSLTSLHLKIKTEEFFYSK